MHRMFAYRVSRRHREVRRAHSCSQDIQATVGCVVCVVLGKGAFGRALLAADPSVTSASGLPAVNELRGILGALRLPRLHPAPVVTPRMAASSPHPSPHVAHTSRVAGVASALTHPLTSAPSTHILLCPCPPPRPPHTHTPCSAPSPPHTQHCSSSWWTVPRGRT